MHALRDLSQNARFSVERLYAFFRDRNMTEAEGACGVGLLPDAAVDGGLAAPTRAFCVEPNAGSAELLRLGLAKLGVLEHVKVSPLALGSVPGGVVFGNFEPGFERGSASLLRHLTPAEVVALGPNAGVVPVDTLDAFALRHGIDDGIDLLSIDTEGDDARVLAGAAQLLSHRRVRLLEFEYHGIGHWRDANLEDLVDWLDNLGYTCYFQTNGGNLVQLTACYSTKYNQAKFWSNVACALRSEAVAQRMHEIASNEVLWVPVKHHPTGPPTL